MSPPITRFEFNDFEKTYSHKLYDLTVQDLEQLKLERQDRIREIEERYFAEGKHAVDIHARVTQAQNKTEFKRKKAAKDLESNQPIYSRGQDPPPAMGTYMYNEHLNSQDTASGQLKGSSSQRA